MTLSNEPAQPVPTGGDTRTEDKGHMPVAENSREALFTSNTIDAFRQLFRQYQDLVRQQLELHRDNPFEYRRLVLNHLSRLNHLLLMFLRSQMPFRST